MEEEKHKYVALTNTSTPSGTMACPSHTSTVATGISQLTALLIQILEAFQHIFCPVPTIHRAVSTALVKSTLLSRGSTIKEVYKSVSVHYRYSQYLAYQTGTRQHPRSVSDSSASL